MVLVPRGKLSISPGEFAEEARYDLVVAEMLLGHERFKPDKCRDSEDAFYLGRRALYMLQQAVEKATRNIYHSSKKW